jgi:hypothetical protein
LDDIRRISAVYRQLRGISRLHANSQNRQLSGSIVDSRGAGPVVIAALLGFTILKRGSDDES